jgi:mycarose O-acyltransferase
MGDSLSYAQKPHARDRSSILPTRLPSLTGLRFVAAMLVFFDHVQFQWTSGGFPNGLLFGSISMQAKYGSIFGRGGSTGVSFFFMLSGFVLAWSARPDDKAPVFWRRRFFKVYPNHLFNATFVLVMFAAVSDVAIDKRDAVLNLLLLHTWQPRIATIFSVNPMAWSLSCEALFYFSFPLLMRYISRIRPERLWVWTGGVVVAVFLIPSVAQLVVPHHLLGPGMPERFWFIYLFPPVRVLEFVLGILLARIVMTGRALPFGLGGSVAVAIGAYAMEGLFPTEYTYVAIMVLPLGLVLASAASMDVQGRPTPLAHRRAVWLGEVSFAFYLWHFPVLVYGLTWFSASRGFSTPLAFTRLALFFVISLTVAGLVYTFLERPVYRRFATSPRRRRTAVGQSHPAHGELHGESELVAAKAPESRPRP